MLRLVFAGCLRNIIFRGVYFGWWDYHQSMFIVLMFEHVMKKKDCFEYIFQQIDGLYVDITNQFTGTLADFFSAWNIVVDDYLQFGRFILDNYVIEYRAYGAKIRINVTPRNC